MDVLQFGREEGAIFEFGAPYEPPEAYSGQVLSLRPEMLKMSLLRPILARFCA